MLQSVALASPVIRPQTIQIAPDRIVAGAVYSQRGGEGPAIDLAGKYPGEHGLNLMAMRFRDGASVEGSTTDHLLMINLGGPVRISCRMNGRSDDFVKPTGNLTICPAGCEFSANAERSTHILQCAVPKDLLSAFSAERAVPMANLLERLSGRDETLNRTIFDLAHEIRAGFAGGPAYWQDLTDTLLGRLLRDHLADERNAGRGVLSPEHLARINAYVAENMGETINVDVVADLVARGRSQFPKIFRRSVGMSPYQYIVRLRLKMALEMMRRREMTLAEVASATGFTDQSHFSHWVKRIYGVTPLKWATAFR